MKQKWLKSETEHQQFINKFDEISGNPLTLTYLKTAQVRGFFKNGELVGGYIVNTQQPLRYFQWVPEDKRPNSLAAKYMDQGQAVEITCIWGDRYKISRLTRRWIYWMCVFDSMRTGKTWIFGGSVIPKVAKIHRQVLPKVVYKGTTTLPGSPEGQLYCARWIQLLLMIPIGFTYDISSDILRNLMKKLSTPPEALIGASQKKEG